MLQTIRVTGISALRSSTSSRLALIGAHIRPSYNSIRTMATTNDLPATMAGVIIEKTGGTDVLQYKTDLPVPQPKEDEVIVKNEYIGLNYIDTCVHPQTKSRPILPHWQAPRLT